MLYNCVHDNIFVKMKAVLCLFPLLAVVIAQYPTIQVEEGSDFNLMCKTSINSSMYSCHIQDGTYEYSQSHCTYEPSSQQHNQIKCSSDLTRRVEFTGNIKNGICNFKISNAKMTDNGYWGCQVKVNNYTPMEWTYVTVIPTAIKSTYSVTEGSPMTLECESNQMINYCQFSHKNANCCWSNWQKNCICKNRNLSIHLVKNVCQIRIKKVFLHDSGTWTCKLNSANYQETKIHLEVVPMYKSTTPAKKESNIDTTTIRNTISSDESNQKFQESTITLIIVGSVACVIVCGLISVGILHYYSKKYPSSDSTEND